METVTIGRKTGRSRRRRTIVPELPQSKLLIINGLGLELVRRIKAAFKPHGILNSGKVL